MEQEITITIDRQNIHEYLQKHIHEEGTEKKELTNEEIEYELEIALLAYIKDVPLNGCTDVAGVADVLRRLLTY